MALDLPTRVGLGGTALFTLAGLASPLLGWGISGSVMGICVFVAAWGFWPLMRERLPSKTQIESYWRGSARTHATFLGILLLGIGLGSVIGKNRYGFWNINPNTGPIVWNFEETASGRGYFLNMQKPSGQEIKVVGFGGHGKNNSSEPITDFDAYLRSDVTNETMPIYLVAAETDAPNVCSIAVPTLPKDSLGIPAFADFDVVTFKKLFVVNRVSEDAIPLTEFMNRFVPFTIVMTYNGRNYQRHFSKDEVDKQIALLEKIAAPVTTPHVVRKQSAPLPDLPPLATPRPQPANPDSH